MYPELSRGILLLLVFLALALEGAGSVSANQHYDP